MPGFGLWIIEEVVNDNVIKLKTFCLVYCQTEYVLENHWELILLLLVTDDDYLGAAEVGFAGSSILAFIGTFKEGA